MLSDVGKLGSLMSVAKKYLQTSAGWNLLQFAGEMDALTPGNLTISTLPSTPGPDIPHIGSREQRRRPHDPADSAAGLHLAARRPQHAGPGHERHGGQGQLRQGQRDHEGARQAAPPRRRPRPASPWTCTTPARRRTWRPTCRRRSSGKGYKAGITQEYPSPIPLTTVTYGTGAQANAAAIAKDFNVTATASSTVPAGHVQVILGGSVSYLPAAFGGTAPDRHRHRHSVGLLDDPAGRQQYRPRRPPRWRRKPRPSTASPACTEPLTVTRERPATTGAGPLALTTTTPGRSPGRGGPSRWGSCRRGRRPSPAPPSSPGRSRRSRR